MIKKLDFYIIKKFLATFFLSLTLIMVITVVFDITEKLEDFVEKQATLHAIIFDYYIYFIPYFANMFAPLFIFISVVFFTSRMAYNNEFISMLSAGISFHRIMWPYFITSLFLASLSYYFGNYIIPKANLHRLEFEERYVHNRFVFRDHNVYRQIRPNIYIYFETYSAATNTAYKYSMERFKNDSLIYKLNSSFIRWDSTKNKWSVYNYNIRHLNGIKESLYVGNSFDTTFVFTPSDFHKRENIVEAMTLPELDKYIEQLRMQGDPRIEKVQAFKNQRIAMPFSTFILTLIGVTLSSRKVRGGSGLHIGIGIALSFTYIFLMQISRNIALGSGMNIILGVWMPNIIYTIIAIYLYIKAPK